MPKAIIVGSGPGGSVMAMELAEAGWDVVIFEMGPSYYTNIEGQGPFGRCSPTTSSSRSTATSSSPTRWPTRARFAKCQPERGEHLRRRRQRSAQPGRRRVPALGREGHPDVGHRLQGTVAARPGARRGHGGLAVRVQRARAVLRRGRDADRGARRCRVDTRIRPEAPAAIQALPDAARGTNALVDAACRRGETPGTASLSVPDGGQFGRIQRLPGVQQLRVLFRLRVSDLRQAGQPHHAAAGAAHRAGAVAATDHRHPGQLHRPPGHRRLLSRRGGQCRLGKAPTWLCCPAPRS